MLLADAGNKHHEQTTAWLNEYKYVHVITWIHAVKIHICSLLVRPICRGRTRWGRARHPLSDWHFRPHLASYLGAMFGRKGMEKNLMHLWCNLCIFAASFPLHILKTSEFAEKRESWKQLALAWSRRKTPMKCWQANSLPKGFQSISLIRKVNASWYLWLRGWLDVSLAQHRFSLPEQISGLSWIHMVHHQHQIQMTLYHHRIQKLRSWPRLQALISSASCIRTTSERMPRCFCLETHVSVSLFEYQYEFTWEWIKATKRASSRCSLLSKSNHSNEVWTMCNIVLNYMIMNHESSFIHDAWTFGFVQRAKFVEVCLIQFHLETSHCRNL